MSGRRLRVLLTGATGFIGQNLVDRLPLEWETVALVRRPTVLPDRITPVRVPEPEEPLPQILAHGFDLVLHLAGNSNHGLAETKPWEDLSATASSAAVILGRIEARRIVLLSSAAVYAGHSGLVGPDTWPRPAMMYALSKLYVEGFVQAFAATGRCESYLVLRLYNAFGPGERPTRLIPRVIAAATATNAFHLTGDPSSLSDPLHVDIVVEALLAASSASASGIFDLCGGDPVPLADRVERIAEAVGLPPPRLVVAPRQGEHPIRFFSDPAPTWARLRMAQPEPFDASVRRYVEIAGLMT